MGKGSGGGGTVVQGPSPEAARIAGEFQVEAAQKASEAARENTLLAIEELRRQTETGRADLGPQRLAGFGALDQLSTSLGLPVPAIGSAGVADLLGQNAGLVNQVFGDQGAAAPGGTPGTPAIPAGGGLVSPGGNLNQDAISAILGLTNQAGRGDLRTRLESQTGLPQDLSALQALGLSSGQGGTDPQALQAIGQSLTGNPAAAGILETLGQFAQPAVAAVPGTPAPAADPNAPTPELLNFGDIELIDSDPSTLFDQIRNTPGFQFQVEEGQKALERSAAARGSLRSGNTLKELQTFGQNVASTQFGDFQNRLAQLAGLGGGASAQAAGLSGALGGQVAGQFGNLGNTLANAELATGQARASSHLAGNQQFQTIGGGGGGGLGSALGGIGSLVGAFKCARIYKTNFTPLSAEDVLTKLNSLPIEKWNYKGEETTHISPYAEDFAAVFEVGNGLTINPIDMFGVMMASIQALTKKVETLEKKHNARF